MVSVAIFSLVVTVILSAQGGLAASNKSSANMGQAITVGRCKMSELEEKMLKLGYPLIDEIDSSATCCDGKEVPGFTCEWRVERVTLPQPPQSTMGDGGFLSMGGSLNGDGGMALGSPTGMPGALPGAIGSVLQNPAGGAQLDFDAGLANIGTTLQQQFGAMGGAAGLLSMVFGIVYPSLKPVLELSIRRVTVTVNWKEGARDRDFTLVQFITNPQAAGLINGVMQDGGVIGDGGIATGTGGAGVGSPVTGASPGGTPFAPGIQR
jgi:general secretion pathway protein I